MQKVIEEIDICVIYPPEASIAPLYTKPATRPVWIIHFLYNYCYYILVFTYIF